MAIPAATRAKLLRLPVGERASLAHDLIVSLDEESDPDADVLWAEEIGRRAREVTNGKATLIDAAVVHREIRAKLRGRRSR